MGAGLPVVCGAPVGDGGGVGEQGGDGAVEFGGALQEGGFGDVQGAQRVFEVPGLGPDGQRLAGLVVVAGV